MVILIALKGSLLIVLAILQWQTDNQKVQVFYRNGNFLSTFGDHRLIFPEGLSINSNGDTIIADVGNKLIKVFSSGGKY